MFNIWTWGLFFDTNKRVSAQLIHRTSHNGVFAVCLNVEKQNLGGRLSRCDYSAVRNVPKTPVKKQLFERQKQLQQKKENVHLLLKRGKPKRLKRCQLNRKLLSAHFTLERPLPPPSRQNTTKLICCCGICSAIIARGRSNLFSTQTTKSHPSPVTR
jgi:hypothetical protein